MTARTRGETHIGDSNVDAVEAGIGRARILVVDDHAVNCELLEAMLAPHGFQVEQAYSGPDALEAAQKHRPDLVLLDVNMPGMDGFEVTRQLRAHPETRLIPIVMVTALGDLEHRVRGLESGADDYLAKPVNRHELLARVRTSLRLAYHRRQVDERQKLELILADVSDGFLILGADAVLREANYAARRLLGLGTDAVGRALQSIWGTLQGVPEGLADAVRDGRDLDFVADRAEPPLFLAARLCPVVDVDGGTTGAVLSLRDVTRETLEHKLQHDVLSLVSHKFRTPLTVISLWTKLLSDGECGTLSEAQRDALQAMLSASDDLRGLLEGMLSYLEWTKRLHALNRVRLSFAELEMALRVQVRNVLSDEQKLVVERHGDGDLFVDGALFVEVLGEMVRNAAKFGGPKVTVRVEMHQEGEARRIVVSDDGPGIPPEQIERIFEQFYQVDADFTGQVRGVGLGLALAKAAVEALGGAIHVQSALQHGARFEITF